MKVNRRTVNAGICLLSILVFAWFYCILILHNTPIQTLVHINMNFNRKHRISEFIHTANKSIARPIATPIKFQEKPHPFCTKDKYIYKWCIGHFVATKQFNETSTQNGDIYWVFNFDLVHFVNHTLPTIQHYFTLVFSSDLDINTPVFWEEQQPKYQGLIARILQHKYLLFYFAENYDGTLSAHKHPNGEHIVHPFPIGLDMHSGAGTHGNMEQYNNIRKVVETRIKPFNLQDRKLQVYMDRNLVAAYPSYLSKWDALFGRGWKVNTNHRTKWSNHSHEILKLYVVQEWQRKYYYRNWIWWQIQNNPKVDKQVFAYDGMSRNKYEGFAKRSEYVFALSLFGTGMDCHRTYESLLVGNIVIVQSSPLDILYEKYDLPVVVVQSVDEINQTMLQVWYEKYKDRVYLNNAETRYKLTNAFWIEYVRLATQRKLNEVLAAH